MTPERALRIGLLGPVLPFRGGIAQHTTRLHRALGERAVITTLSFSRQYPGWLFPGESDRDADHAGHVEAGVEYVVDSLDPLTWRRAVQRFSDAEVAGVVLPWWTAFFAPCFYSITRMLAAREIPVVFMCHNVVDHEATRYKRALSRMVLGSARGICVHSVSEAARVAALLPGARVAVQAHPLYDQFPPAAGALPRRAGLELLFFGFIRPYKGVDVLLDALAMASRRDVRLSVVGEVWRGEETMQRRIDELGIRELVEVVPRFVGEQEAAEFFARADAVVLPYQSATGSGIVAMAYHYGKPVIASRVGGLPDVVLDGRTGYLVEPASPSRLAQAIDAVSREELLEMRPHIEQAKAGLTWSRLADAVLSAFGPSSADTPNDKMTAKPKKGDRG